MAIKCPKCGHERTPNDVGPDYECPKCGVVYAKAARPATAVPVHPDSVNTPRSKVGLFIGGVLLLAAGVLIGSKLMGQKPAPRTVVEVRDVTVMTTSDAARAQERVRKEQEAELARRQEAERERKALDKAVADLERLYGRWKDASLLADSTARIALSGPVATLQAIRRDVGEMIVPACLDGAKRDLVAGMDAQIKGFVFFMQDADLGKILAKGEFGSAKEAFKRYEDGAKGCPGQSSS